MGRFSGVVFSKKQGGRSSEERIRVGGADGRRVAIGKLYISTKIIYIL